MAGAKLVACYPHPTDSSMFEAAYEAEHIPMAARIFARIGATKAVLTKLAETPEGKPHFYRMAEIHFPSMEALATALESADFQSVIADANRISTGGPVVAMISGEEQTVEF